MSGQIGHTEVRMVDALGCLAHILAISLHLFPFYPLLSPPPLFPSLTSPLAYPGSLSALIFTAAITDFKYGQ